MTNEEIIAHQQKMKRFYETDLGKLFRRYSSAHSAYWQNDMNERISDRRLRELAEKSDKAEQELVDALMTYCGIV